MATWKIVGIAIGVVALIAGGVAALLQVQGWQGNLLLDETAVQSGVDLSENRREWLIENELLTTEETVLEFYVDGLFLFEEGGVLLTDKYVGFWDKEDGELVAYWFRHGEICSIETIRPGNIFSDAVYQLNRAGIDDWMQFSLSVEEGGHERFISRLTELNDNAKTEMNAESCLRNERFDGASGIYPLPVTADEMDPKDVALLKSREWLFEGEEIQALVSFAYSDLGVEGTMLTDQVFGTWMSEGGETETFWFELDELCALVELPRDGADGFLWYETRSPETWASFAVPRWDGEGAAMIDALRAQWIEAGGNPEKTCPRFDGKPAATPAKPN